MLDRLIVFSLAAHALQAAILYLDTRGWLGGVGCSALAQSIHRAVRRRRRYVPRPR